MVVGEHAPDTWLIVEHQLISQINPKLPLTDIPDDFQVSFLPMALVQEMSGEICLSETREYREVKKGYTPFVDGDVIFAKITPCMENGKTAVLHGLKNGIGFGSTEFHVSRPSEIVVNKYLFYFFVQSAFRRTAKRNMTGSAGQLRVPSVYFKKVKIPLPPLPEQRAIVAKIEQLFSELDAGIASLKKAQAQLKIYRQAVLKKAFAGLTVQPFSALVASSQNGISKRSAKVGIDFKVLRLADVTALEIDCARPRTIKLTSSEIDKYRLSVNDLVCIRVNGSRDLVGRLVFVNEADEASDWAFCDHFIRFSLHAEKAVAKFFFYYFQLVSVRKYIHDNMVSSAGQNTVSQGIIKSIDVPFCPLQEQHQIVQEIETRLSVCDNIEANIKEALIKAKALRQSILKKTFEGKLLSDQELQEARNAPDWEPAEKLFARIKAEKTKLKVNA